MKYNNKILNVLRYLICLPVVLIFGLITVPFTLFFKFELSNILFIANEEGCAISKARELLRKGDYFKDDLCSNALEMKGDINSIKSYQYSQSNNFIVIDSFNHAQRNSPSYSFLDYNIYHNNR